MARVVHFFKKGTKEMPYRNPEHKRQWEREHRAQRNAQRRMRRLEGINGLIARIPAPDPNSDQPPTSGWKVMAEIGAFVLAVGLGVLAALGGANASLDSGPDRPSA